MKQDSRNDDVRGFKESVDNQIKNCVLPDWENNLAQANGV